MLPVTKRFSLKLGAAFLTLAFLTLGLLGCDVTPVSGNPGNTPTPASTNTPGSAPSTPGSTNTSVGWDSFMVGAQTQGSQYIVLNSNLNDKVEALTQYGLPKVQFGTIAPDGQDVLYWQTVNGQEQFSTALLGPHPFYTEHADSPNLSGNAIWTSDSRHALVLNPLSGIWQVDVQSGQAQKVLSLPVSGQGWYVDGINSLLAYRDGYVYFQGAGGGDCMGAICRLQLGVSHPTLTHYSSRQTGSSDFLLSPDGQTIYYCNTGPVGTAGLYAVNSDGTHSRILRQSTNGSDCGSGSPVGFAADNGLVVMAHLNGKFELIELGATPQQDRVMLADAAPGASSLCASSNEQQFSQDVCPQEVALAPYSHALVVQAVMPGGKLQLWGTDLTTGKQQVLHPIANSSQPLQLLGWDQMTVCGGDRC